MEVLEITAESPLDRIARFKDKEYKDDNCFNCFSILKDLWDSMPMSCDGCKTKIHKDSLKEEVGIYRDYSKLQDVHIESLNNYSLLMDKHILLQNNYLELLNENQLLLNNYVKKTDILNKIMEILIKRDK